MPEGPEIRRAADMLAAAVVGQTLTGTFFAFAELKRYQAELVGQRIESIRPQGKALLTRFNGGLTLYSHNQLYGVWKTAKPGKAPKTNRSLRVALQTARRAILLYSASDVSMWRSDEVHQHPFLQRLGPDVLDSGLVPELIAERLGDRRFAGRSLSALLLDQGFLAGMGNYLRSEVLYEAGIAPRHTPRTLSSGQIEQLAKALIAVPQRSYRSRGIRPAQGMKVDYLIDTPQGFRFHVFDRAGTPCERCSRIIERYEAGGRRLYWCRGCQR